MHAALQTLLDEDGESLKGLLAEQKDLEEKNTALTAKIATAKSSNEVLDRLLTLEEEEKKLKDPCRMTVPSSRRSRMQGPM